jgi:predicted alpha/beta-fold hydrolase
MNAGNSSFATSPSGTEGATTYKPPFFLFNAHLETIYPALFRKVALQPYEREQIATPDQDFLDLDWLRRGSPRLMIISHGLEGSSDRAYVRGMARAGWMNGFDTLAWNYRGCGGEINKQLRFYHSGATDDLQTVLLHARKQYREIFLVGFSLGGNLTLKFLGEQIPYPEIKKAVVFSVPLDLHTSCLKISERSNRVYAHRFLTSLKQKVTEKGKSFPELDTRGLANIKTLKDFDDRYTAPLHGFNTALEYYEQCSSIHFLNTITTPTLIVNAQNDPFLSPDCYPGERFRDHRIVQVEHPQYGGHVGFSQFSKNGLYWSEERALKFFLP